MRPEDWPNVEPLIDAAERMRGAQGASVALHFCTTEGSHTILLSQRELMMNPERGQIEALIRVRMSRAAKSTAP